MSSVPAVVADWLWHWQCNYRLVPTILPNGVINYEMQLLSAIYGSPKGGHVLTCFRDSIRHVGLRRRRRRIFFQFCSNRFCFFMAGKFLVRGGEEERGEGLYENVHTLARWRSLSFCPPLSSTPFPSSPPSPAIFCRPYKTCCLGLAASPSGAREAKRIKETELHPPRYLTNARPYE